MTELVAMVNDQSCKILYIVNYIFGAEMSLSNFLVIITTIVQCNQPQA